MLKVENGIIEADGAPVEMIKEWANLTYALCEQLGNATGHTVTIDTLIESSIKLLRDENNAS